MKKFNILLGYDSPQMLEAIGWALRKEGYRITTVESAEGILEVMTRKSFDLVLIDLDLHKINDSGILHKAKDLNPETMVIILCCKEDVSYSHDALRVDADDYIFKPCSKEKLWERLINCIERLELKRGISSSEPHELYLNEHVLNIVRIAMEEIKSPLISTEDILEQLNCGAYGDMDKRVGTKLRELYKTVRGMDGTVEELIKQISKSTGDLGITQKIKGWREDILSPVLDNIS